MVLNLRSWLKLFTMHIDFNQKMSHYGHPLLLEKLYRSLIETTQSTFRKSFSFFVLTFLWRSRTSWLDRWSINRVIWALIRPSLRSCYFLGEQFLFTLVCGSTLLKLSSERLSPLLSFNTIVSIDWHSVAWIDLPRATHPTRKPETPGCHAEQIPWTDWLSGQPGSESVTNWNRK